MTAPGNSTVLVALLAAFLACSGYAAGRLHQRLRMGRDRDEAYREGYDTATRSVFSLAARIVAPRRSAAVRGSAKVPVTSPSRVSGPTSPGRKRSRLASYRDNARTLPRTGKPGPPPDSDVDTTPLPDLADGDTTRLGRHTVPDELVQAATYRLPPDRVARARVQADPEAGAPDEQTTRLPPVPRPRSS